MCLPPWYIIVGVTILGLTTPGAILWGTYLGNKEWEAKQKD